MVWKISLSSSFPSSLETGSSQEVVIQGFSSGFWSLQNKIMLHVLIFPIIEFYARKARYFIDSYTRIILPPTLSFLSIFLLPFLEREERKYSAKLNAGSWFPILGRFCEVLRHCDSSPPYIGQKPHLCLEVIPTKCIHSLSLVLWILLLKYLLNIFTSVQFYFWHHSVSYNSLSPSK